MIGLIAPEGRLATYETRISNAASSPGGSIIFGDAFVRAVEDAEPNLPRALGIGIDLQNPKEPSPFNVNGNIYGRPEREISLHWDGRELLNRRSPVELRGARLIVEAREVTGGTEVTVTADGTAIYDKEFVPFARLLGSKWSSFGLSNLGRGDVRGVPGVLDRADENLIVGGINDAGHHSIERTVELPTNTTGIGRVIATLTLGPTPAGIDPWDRLASLSLADDGGRRFEILRCITPYKKGWTWFADVTHLMPLLSGRKRIRWDCATYGAGWTVDASLSYVPGPLRERPISVEPLWQGTYEIGTGKPGPAPKSAVAAARAKIFTTVTGHGQAPNSGNAAEFLPLDRTLRVGEISWTNRLWKDDVYLNPCRPQSGTWKYDRAGWAPGSVVAPWAVDVTKALRRPSELRYEIEPFTNPTPDAGNPAVHVIESVLVRYAR